MTLSGPISRIVLRYAIGISVAYAMLTPAGAEQIVSDPDVQVLVEAGVSAVMAGAVEGYYWAAKRWGWDT